jgi:hypothetical protein
LSAAIVAKRLRAAVTAAGSSSSGFGAGSAIEFPPQAACADLGEVVNGDPGWSGAELSKQRSAGRPAFRWFAAPPSARGKHRNKISAAAPLLE